MKAKKFISIILSLSIFMAAGCGSVDTSAQGQSSASGFTDVAITAWYYGTVTEMAQKGILSGYDDGSFKPDNTITSAEFTTILCRIKGLSPKSAQTSHWSAPLMQAALDAGWYDYDENPPTGEKYDQPIIRQIAVKILMKALADSFSYDYNVESAKMKDFSKLSGRYYDTVLAAYSAGIAGGDNNGNFNPDKPLTRAEACTLIKRAMDKYNTAVSATPQTSQSSQPAVTPQQTAPVSTEARAGGVSQNGQLKVVGTQLCNESGAPVVLRGMSSHGLQWFPQFVSNEYIKAVGDRGANVMRFAMYTSENGYIQDPSVKSTLTTAVDNTLKNDMYAIIDWHILSDGNPMTYVNEAEQFFKEMAAKYKDSKGIIYEICNEPNGGISWSGNVKPYAERIIPAIRAIDNDAVILVGNPQWDQDLDSVVADRLSFDNIMYTCHFYSGTHTQWLRDRVLNAVKNGIPIFVSEWGTSDASGNGGVFADETQKWMEFLSANNISWCNWSLCDKNETSAALVQGSNASDGLSDSELSASGKIVFSYFNK